MSGVWYASDSYASDRKLLSQNSRRELRASNSRRLSSQNAMAVQDASSHSLSFLPVRVSQRIMPTASFEKNGLPSGAMPTTTLEIRPGSRVSCSRDLARRVGKYASSSPLARLTRELSPPLSSLPCVSLESEHKSLVGCQNFRC